MSLDTLHIAKMHLGEVGLKVTQQRLVIYNFLLKNRTHPNAEEILTSLISTNPSLSLATVYKTVEALEEVGLIKKIVLNNGPAKYDAVQDHHHHLVCKNTGEIIDYDDEELSQLIASYLQKKQITNFEIKDIQLQITGLKKDIEKKIQIN